MKNTEPTQLPVTAYHFKYGVLYLERATADSMTNEEVIDYFGGTKGELGQVVQGEMDAAAFYNLDDFSEI